MAVKFGGAVSLINFGRRARSRMYYVVLPPVGVGGPRARARRVSERVHAVLWDGVMNLWGDAI